MNEAPETRKKVLTSTLPSGSPDRAGELAGRPGPGEPLLSAIAALIFAFANSAYLPAICANHATSVELCYRFRARSRRRAAGCPAPENALVVLVGGEPHPAMIPLATHPMVSAAGNAMR